MDEKAYIETIERLQKEKRDLEVKIHDMLKANGGYNSVTAAIYEKKYQDAENDRKRLLEENDKLRCENRELHMQLIAIGEED